MSFPPCSCGESWALHVKAAAVQPRLVTRGQENAEKPEPLAGGHRVGALGHPSDPKPPGLIADVFSSAKEWLRSAKRLFSWTFMTKLFLVRSTSRSFGAPKHQCHSWGMLAPRYISIEDVSLARLLEVFGYQYCFQVLEVLGFYFQLPDCRSCIKLP